MQIGVYSDGVIKGEFMFSPLFEFFASMHVITKPEHHLDRMDWALKQRENMSETFMKKLVKYGGITNEWLIVMDFAHISPFKDMTIPQAFKELENLSLLRWNKLFKHYNKVIGKQEKAGILETMRAYYEISFKDEINFLEAYLVRNLKKELEAAREEGLLNRIRKIHERIKVNGTEIVLYKNKEYHFDALKLENIVITASTFISPHLLMLEQEGILYLTKLVVVEDKKDIVPADLVLFMKALGDETRLKLLHLIRREAASTQSLAKDLQMSEAGVSKHLKILYNAGLVNKWRQGNYQLYKLNKESIDFIPYRLYEYILRH